MTTIVLGASLIIPHHRIFREANRMVPTPPDCHVTDQEWTEPMHLNPYSKVAHSRFLSPGLDIFLYGYGRKYCLALVGNKTNTRRAQ